MYGSGKDTEAGNPFSLETEINIYQKGLKIKKKKKQKKPHYQFCLYPIN